MNLKHLVVLLITLLLCVTTAYATLSKSAETKSPSIMSQQLSAILTTKRPILAATTTTTTSSSNSRIQQPKRQHHHKHHQRAHVHPHRQVQLPQRRDVANSSRTAYHPDHDVEILNHISSSVTFPLSTQSTQRRNVTDVSQQTTRLRRVYTHDYKHNGAQRRSRVVGNINNAGRSVPNEWAYHTYNVQSNTFGAPPPAFPASIGKGDDNTLDVEFIGSSNTNSKTDWSLPHPRGYPTTTTTTSVHLTPTTAPPPLVPVRRGYTTSAPSSLNGNELSPVTDDPFETNIISRNPQPNDPKEMERRHICVQQRTITMPVKTTEVYVRPMWKHVNTPCQPPTYPNQMCTRVQLVHEQAYRDVIRHKSAQHVTFDCCTGWMREMPHADACLKPVCATHCQNGGSCTGPDTCTCPAGFTGHHCEHDINECKEEKPCDQTCINTVGSYYCKCREGFVLQSDQQSCKKIDVQDDDAFEARDLENEIETDDNDSGVQVRDNEVTARLHKIERSLANERIQTHELQKSLQATYHVVDTLKNRLNTLEKQQHDLNRLQTNLFDTESRTNKLEGMVNLLMKCRNGPNAYCP